MNETSAVAPARTSTAQWTPSAQPQTTGPDRSFDTYTPDEQQSMRKKLDALAAKGRIFRQMEPGGRLVQAEPSDVFNSLERHVGLTWVIDNTSKVLETHSSDDRFVSGYERTRQSADGSLVDANYSGSPLLGWTDLSFIRTEPNGLPGVSEIAQPVGTTTTQLSEHLASSYWRQTGWVLDVPTGVVSTTSYVAGSQQSSRTWNLA